MKPFSPEFQWEYPLTRVAFLCLKVAMCVGFKKLLACLLVGLINGIIFHIGREVRLENLQQQLGESDCLRALLGSTLTLPKTPPTNFFEVHVIQGTRLNTTESFIRHHTDSSHNSCIAGVLQLLYCFSKFISAGEPD